MTVIWVINASDVGWNDKQPFGVRLRNLQRETIELRFDLKNLRRQTESNCKQASFILQDAFHQIKAVLMKSENGNFLSNVQEITHHRDRFNGAVVKIERYLT